MLWTLLGTGVWSVVCSPQPVTDKRCTHRRAHIGMM